MAHLEEEDAFKHYHQLGSSNSPRQCLLLALPFELRVQIYSHVLPKTVRLERGIAWQRGPTAILATNRQIYHETTQWIYGENDFVIEVDFGGPRFRYNWLAYGLMPSKTKSFPDCFATCHVKQIRKYYISVEQVDSYTGMVKYNCAGKGLTAGLTNQVEALCKILEQALELHTVSVALRTINCRNTTLGQALLEPLSTLRNVRHPSITGSITLDYAKALEDSMTCLSLEKTAHLLKLPLELRGDIYG
ncbi:MAG: hypothetical protein M1812_005079 [Candelaria pacifica]|nr:MAG: hypothetical protein M1812_005079 [Candelaria pacifica]